jgi:hypothetical protein
MGNARSLLTLAAPIAAAVLVLACTPARPAESAATAARCLVADTTRATPDTVYAIVDVARRATIDCERRPVEASNTPIAITITPPPGADVRDILEGREARTLRPDVVVTRDPLVIDFARRSGGYLVEPLAWNTTYVLAVLAPDAAAVPNATERDAMARDAVIGDARGAVEPFPWLADGSCAQPPAPRMAAPTLPPPVVAYSSGDPIARAIGERLVSLAGSRGSAAWLPSALARPGATFRVAPVATDSIVHVLTLGGAAAAVVAVARDPSTPCGTRDNTPVMRGAIPLVDARPHVIVRRGSGAAFIVGVDGTLHFVKRGAR